MAYTWGEENIKYLNKHGVQIPYERQIDDISTLINTHGVVDKNSISDVSKIINDRRRVYMPSKKLKSRRGILIVSTPKGLMTSRDARKKNVGGEVMVEIY